MRWALLVLWLFSCTASADGPTPASLLVQLQQRHGFPGATLAWAGPGGQGEALAIGMADPERHIAMTPGSHMLAASIGKSFVAAAIVSAAGQGQLDLDAPLSDYLGEQHWYTHLPNHGQLTLRHLLNHTAGLPDHVYQPAFTTLFARTQDQAEPVPTAQQLVALILDGPALFAVGDDWAYSDTGYLLAAMALEAATQKPWTAHVRERFLEPLALNDTGPSSERRIPGLAVGMTAADNAFGLPARTAGPDGALLWHPGIEGAGGGLFSAAPDLARWGRALWSGETLGKDGTRQLLDGVPVQAGDAARLYGLGVLIEQGGPFGDVHGHRGWIPGYVSSLRYYPQYGVAIAIQVNTDVGMMGQEGALVQIETALTQAILEKAVPLPASSP